jgi:membrane protein implicated in regulation of membrane protease activity
VSTEGEKIPVHTRIEIFKIEDNKIYVRKKDN